MANLLTSQRFWTALLGIAALLAVQFGVSQEYALKLQEAILALILVLIGGYSVRGAGK
jgi:hypothetical protein